MTNDYIHNISSKILIPLETWILFHNLFVYRFPKSPRAYIFVELNNVNDNYFVTSYSGVGNKLDAVDGTTNVGIAKLATSTWGANSNFNAVDAVEFNKAKYVVVYGGMHFTYSQCMGFMFDVTSLAQFTGSLNDSPSLVFMTNDYRFGSPILASSDILMIPSPDGYKLRLYYTDANCRGLVAWEFDCIEK